MLDIFNQLLVDREQGFRNGVKLTGNSLTVGQLLAVQDSRVKIDASDEDLKNLHLSVDTLAQLLKGSVPIYGVTTGFGGSANTRIRDPQDSVKALMYHLAVGFNRELPQNIVRGLLCVRINSILKNHSGVREEVVRNMISLLNKNILPWVPERGSISASGDLVPSVYLTTLLAGDKNAKVYVPNKKEMVTAPEALDIAGIKPTIFRPKEVLAIVNGSGASSSMAVNAISNAFVLIHLTQALSAMAVEMLKGSIVSFDPFVAEVRPDPGQIEVAQNIHKMLETSKFIREHPRSFKIKGELYQDRYALRTSPQWLGPSLNLLASAFKALTIELNSTTDNPLFNHKNGNKYESGNFQASSVALAMETVRITLQQMGKLLFSQFQELIDVDMNKGLPPNLAFDEPSIDYGFKGLDTSMASFMSELSWVSNTVTNHVQSAELHNQNVNSLALISGRASATGADIVSMMCSVHLFGLCQAADLREIQYQFLQKLKLYFKGRAQQDMELFPGIKNIDEFLFEECALELIHHQSTHFEERFIKVFSNVFGEVFKKTKGDQSKINNVQALREWPVKRADEVLQIFFDARNNYNGEASQTLGLTASLYKFVRNDLQIKMNKGPNDPTAIGQQIQKILESIKDWSIVPHMMKCFPKNSQSAKL